MRRAFTLPELALVLAITGALLGIAAPSVLRVADSLAVHHAALELVSAHRRARMSAVLRSRSLELTVAPDSLVIRAAGDSAALWRAPGPSALGVALAGPPRTLRFSPVGMTFGLSNASFRLTRGAAARTVIVSRLGRVRVTP